MSRRFELHLHDAAAPTALAPPARETDPDVAEVAHDLRDGLSLVRSSAQRALSTPRGVRAWREEVRRIEGHTAHLAGLVDRLLAPPTPASEASPALPPVRPSVYRTGGAVARELVLLVDDSQAICDLAAEALDDRYDVAIAGTAADALRLARELHPHVVVAEAQLPDGDGDTLLTEAREDASLADVPFVLVPATGDAGERARLLRLGARDVLCKPFGRAELREHVDALLDRRRPARTPLPAGAAEVVCENALRALVDSRLERAAAQGRAIALVAAEVRARTGLRGSAEAIRADATLDRLHVRLAARLAAGDVLARVDGRQLVAVCPRPGTAGASAMVAQTVSRLRRELPDVASAGVTLGPTETGAGDALDRLRAQLHGA